MPSLWREERIKVASALGGDSVFRVHQSSLLSTFQRLHQASAMCLSLGPVSLNPPGFGVADFILDTDYVLSCGSQAVVWMLEVHGSLTLETEACGELLLLLL